MSRYDPQRRRRLTTRANTTAVEALLEGEPTRPRRRAGNGPGGEPGAVRSEAGRPPHGAATTVPPEARSGCLTGLLTLGRR